MGDRCFLIFEKRAETGTFKVLTAEPRLVLLNEKLLPSVRYVGEIFGDFIH